MAILEVKDIHKSFGSNNVLKGIDFELEECVEVHSIVMMLLSFVFQLIASIHPIEIIVLLSE